MEKIGVYFLNISQLAEFLLEYYQTQFGIEKDFAEVIVREYVTPLTTALNDDLSIVIETPYVDKIYRNTYYHYYSSKLKTYKRDSLRISFFSEAIEESKFRDRAYVRILGEKYLGFLVIRPTLPKIIGRNAISPLAFKEHKFRCCVASLPTTVNSLKFLSLAFPHSSQDGQVITCAETTIWSMLEYFGNRYPEYKPLLPSDIHQILKKFSFKRQIPSDGLTAEQIAYTVREVGFGAMLYSKSKHAQLFNGALSAFIESGIPVVGVIRGETLAHAVNIIGAGSEDRRAIINNPTFDNDAGDIPVVDYNKVDRQYVFIDDNQPPYRLAGLDQPCAHYTQEAWKACELTHIIVPLYHRIYLDPIRARNNVMALIKLGKPHQYDTTPRVIRLFLASSRSYKEYVALNDELHSDTKAHITHLPMPKFIWIAELSTFESFEKQLVTGVIVLDATEPTDSSGSQVPLLYLLEKGKFVTIDVGKYKIINTFVTPFRAYEGNLVNFERQNP